MPSNSAALPPNRRSEQNEQTIERALIIGFVMVVAMNVFWMVGGTFEHLSQHILSQLHSSIIHLY
jgi:ATP-dependent protease Clp ATPase subunit